MFRSVLVVVALGGCGGSEYEVLSQPDPETGEGVCTPVLAPGFDTDRDPRCAIEPQTGGFTPTIEWYATSFPGPEGNNVMSMPIVTSLTDDDGDGDIDEEDIPDIVFVSYLTYNDDGILRAIDGATGSQLWANDELGLQYTAGVAAGDIDGDGVVELISVGRGAVVAVEHDGTEKWRREGLEAHMNGASDTAAISDMDHDGRPEIIVGRAILTAEGTVRGIGEHGMAGVPDNAGTCAFAVDLDGDGVEEVITGNAAYRPDGSALWFNKLADGYPAVADLDGDGRGEIVVSGQTELRILETDGTLLTSTPIPGATEIRYGGPPTIADFDGDGDPEIGIAAGSRYSVVEVDGTILWQAVTDDASSGNTGSSVFDFEGDGVAEVVYADQTRLWVFNGIDGTVKLSSPAHNSGTWLEYP